MTILSGAPGAFSSTSLEDKVAHRVLKFNKQKLNIGLNPVDIVEGNCPDIRLEELERVELVAETESKWFDM
jgi:hypothetical protein